jgi:hypothetical protein
MISALRRIDARNVAKFRNRWKTCILPNLATLRKLPVGKVNPLVRVLSSIFCLSPPEPVNCVQCAARFATRIRKV